MLRFVTVRAETIYSLVMMRAQWLKLNTYSCSGETKYQVRGNRANRLVLSYCDVPLADLSFRIGWQPAQPIGELPNLVSMSGRVFCRGLNYDTALTLTKQLQEDEILGSASHGYLRPSVIVLCKVQGILGYSVVPQINCEVGTISSPT